MKSAAVAALIATALAAATAELRIAYQEANAQIEKIAEARAAEQAPEKIYNEFY